MPRKTLRTCKKGHTYFKSSDCPTCPICEEEKKPKDGFMLAISAPARRALESAGIKTLKQLSKFTEQEISKLHGMGPTGVLRLKNELKKKGLLFKKI